VSGLYGAIGDVAREIVAQPSKRDRLAAVEFLAEELRGYLAESDLGEGERREIVQRLVTELQREAIG
jgi:hypothetical protein